MLKNNSKIYQHTAFILLVIIVSSLLNICLFTFQAKASTPQSSVLKINFFNNNYSSDDCIQETTPEPEQTIDRPSAPMPECCLAQNRNFDAIINTATDKSDPTSGDLIISSSTDLSFKNNSTYNTSQNIYPPPATLALASTVIRE